MKVAVIYAGEPRSWRKCVDNHKKFLKGLDYDTYHGFWHHRKESDTPVAEQFPNTKYVGYAHYDARNRPDLVRFEKMLLNHTDNHPIFMLGRIQDCVTNAIPLRFEGFHTYDYIVRLRYDYTYDGKLSDLLFEANAPHVICTTREMGGKSHEHNVWDGFAFGMPFAMSFYVDFSRWIPYSLYNGAIQNWKFQPEFVLGTYLRTCGLEVKNVSVKPTATYVDGWDVNKHRRERTLKYYEDLARFHPEFWTVTDGKIDIINDSPVVPDEEIIKDLSQRGRIPN